MLVAIQKQSDRQLGFHTAEGGQFPAAHRDESNQDSRRPMLPPSGAAVNPQLFRRQPHQSREPGTACRPTCAARTPTPDLTDNSQSPAAMAGSSKPVASRRPIFAWACAESSTPRWAIALVLPSQNGALDRLVQHTKFNSAWHHFDPNPSTDPAKQPVSRRKSAPHQSCNSNAIVEGESACLKKLERR